MKQLLAILPALMLASSLFGQGQGVSLRATNGVAFGRLTVQSHIHATNTTATNVFAGKIQQGDNTFATSTRSVAFGVNTLSRGSYGIVGGVANDSVASSALVMGTSNILGSGATDSLVAGRQNNVQGINSFVVGRGNDVDGDAAMILGTDLDTASGAHGNFVAGRNVSVWAGSSNNFIWNSGPTTAVINPASNSFLVSASGAIRFSGTPIQGSFLGLIPAGDATNAAGSRVAYLSDTNGLGGIFTNSTDSAGVVVGSGIGTNLALAQTPYVSDHDAAQYRVTNLYGVSLHSGGITLRDGVGSVMANVRGGGDTGDAAQDSQTTDNFAVYARNVTFPHYNNLASAWTNTATYSLASVQMRCGRTTDAGGTLRVRLYAAVAGKPVGGVLGLSEAINVSTLSDVSGADSATPVNFAFTSPVSLTNGGIYAIVLEVPTFSGTAIGVRTYNYAGPLIWGSTNLTVWDSTQINGRFYFVMQSTDSTNTPGQLSLFADASQSSPVTNIFAGPISYQNPVLKLEPGNPPVFRVTDGTNRSAVFTGDGSGLTNLSLGALPSGVLTNADTRSWTNTQNGVSTVISSNTVTTGNITNTMTSSSLSIVAGTSGGTSAGVTLAGGGFLGYVSAQSGASLRLSSGSTAHQVQVFGSTVAPTTDATMDLGVSTARYKTLYLTNLVQTGSGGGAFSGTLTATNGFTSYGDVLVSGAGSDLTVGGNGVVAGTLTATNGVIAGDTTSTASSLFTVSGAAGANLFNVDSNGNATVSGTLSVSNDFSTIGAASDANIGGNLTVSGAETVSGIFRATNAVSGTNFSTINGSVITSTNVAGYVNIGSTAGTITASGLITGAGGINSSLSVTAGSSSRFSLSTKWEAFGPFSGHIHLTDSTNTGFSLLSFGAGSTTASMAATTNWPAIRVDSSITNGGGVLSFRRGTNNIAGDYWPTVVGSNLVAAGTLTATNGVYHLVASNNIAAVDQLQRIGQFGQMYYGATNTVTILDGVYTNIAASAAWTEGNTNGFTLDLTAGSLTNTFAGWYPIKGHIDTFNAVANNGDEIEFEAFVNDVGNERLSSRGTLGGAGSFSSFGFEYNVFLPANSRVDLRVKGIGTTDPISIVHAALVVGSP